jgi:periplasmic divalent cation tolerance protein
MAETPPPRVADLRVVLITAPDGAVAKRIAETLVGEGLAACVNVLPGIASVYRWHGSLERAEETLLIAKTTAALVPSLEKRLGEVHPYEVPECIALEAASVAPAYLRWVLEESGGRSA